MVAAQSCEMLLLGGAFCLIHAPRWKVADTPDSIVWERHPAVVPFDGSGSCCCCLVAHDCCCWTEDDYCCWKEDGRYYLKEGARWKDCHHGAEWN